MNKKKLIALADAIKRHNATKLNCFGKNAQRMLFNDEQLSTLADFLQASNPLFKRELWLNYVAGNCGSNGGKLTPEKV